jgi:hypothetical protein
VETRSRGPRRELLEEVKATRGSTIDHRLTPVRCARTFRMHQSLESAYERSIHRRFRAAASKSSATARGAKRAESIRRGGYRKGESSEGREKSPRASLA